MRGALPAWPQPTERGLCSTFVSALLLALDYREYSCFYPGFRSSCTPVGIGMAVTHRPVEQIHGGNGIRTRTVGKVVHSKVYLMVAWLTAIAPIKEYSPDTPPSGN